jgi:AcrR family transcriptional regulator
LAKGFNVNRSTFYRHYSAITNAMLDSAAQQHADGPKRRLARHTDGDRDETIRRLRTENNDLRRHLEIYEERIRMLTIDNTNQKSQLDRLAGVTDLNARRNP